MEKRYDVFISYSTQDQKVVEGIRDFLEREGYRCFVAYRDIPRGVVWATAITDAIDASAMMLVVFSNAFNGSPQTDREIELASENRIPILTFRVANAPMTGAKKYYLKNLNWIDAFPNPENYFGNLLDSVVRLIGPSSIVMDRAAEEEAERLAREEAERKAREEAERERLAAQGIFPGAFPHGGNPVFTGVSEGRRNFEPDEPSTPPPPVVPTDKPTPKNKKPLWIALGAVAALVLLLLTLPKKQSLSVSGSYNGHDYVDLGLPSGTLWATCNVGADKPEEYGNYYAWGETSPKTSNTYNWSSYKYANGDYNKLTKYCNNSDYGDSGFTDNLTELQSGDDPATSNWGSGWQTPSKTQWDELLSNTTRKWTAKNGAKGRIFTSKKNGQSIFLPAAGSFGVSKLRDIFKERELPDGIRDSELLDVGFRGYYWSRSLRTDFSGAAWHLYFYSGSCDMECYGSRYCGESVRPVRSAR